MLFVDRKRQLGKCVCRAVQFADEAESTHIKFNSVVCKVQRSYRILQRPNHAKIDSRDTIPRSKGDFKKWRLVTKTNLTVKR